MPPVPTIFEVYDEDRHNLKMSGDYAIDYTSALARLLKYFSSHPVIRESVFFKKFIEIDKMFPDEFARNRHKKNNHGFPQNRTTLHYTQSVSNLDLLPDGYNMNGVLSPKGTRQYSTLFYSMSNQEQNNSSPNADTDDDDTCVVGE